MSTDEITNYNETLKEVWGILQGSRDAIRTIRQSIDFINKVNSYAISRDAIYAIRQSIDFIDNVNSYAIFALDKTVIPYVEKVKIEEGKVVE